MTSYPALDAILPAEGSGIVVLAPAYGRAYTGPDKAVEDWKKGLDFRMPHHGGVYCSSRDAKTMKRDHKWKKAVILLTTNTAEIVIRAITNQPIYVEVAL